MIYIKKKAPALMASLLLAGAAWAQTSPKPVVLKTPNEYYILAASANGKWACGVYADYSNEQYGFLWNLESGEIELLGAANPSVAYSVSDNGIVAGQYTDNSYKANGAAVTLAGYWANGKWNRLELPEDAVEQAIAYSISPDGHYVAGSVKTESEYQGYVWKDGRIDRKLAEKKGLAMPYAVSPDGKLAAGWVQGANRQATLWEADGSMTTLSTLESPWSSGRKFSPDGKKLLFFDGWNEFDGKYGVNAIYDVQSGEKTPVFPADDNADFDFFDISDNGTVMCANNERGYVWQNGAGQYADLYLQDKGVDVASEHILKMDGTDYYQIFRASTVSADDNVMGFQYYNDDTASDGSYSVSVQSMVVKLNQQSTGIVPVSLKASQMSGTSSVMLSWKPNVAAEGITGYNVYRDDAKVNASPVADPAYVDAGVEAGSHSYSVTALYGDAESPKSEAASVSVAASLPLAAPQNVFAQQRGYSSAHMEWEAPKSNLGTMTYFDAEDADKETFGLNLENQSFETGVLFGKAQASAYKGMKLKAVAFYPLSEQGGWKINVYTRDAIGSLQLLASQTVSQQLALGERNVVRLDGPVDIPDGDLLVAAEVLVTEPSLATNILDTRKATEGYSDLVRLTTEADFYSIGALMQSAGYQYPATWAIDAIVAPVEADLSADDVTAYRVYADGELAGETTTRNFTLASLAEGTHSLAVSSVYADGNESDAKATTVSITPDASQLKGVDAVSMEYSGDSKTAVSASWQAPENRDAVKLQYCSETASSQSVVGPSSNNYGIMAGAEYTPKTFRGRTGYVCRSVRFYPLSDATFTVLVYKNDEQISETEVESYTKGQWNEVTLSEPFTIEQNASYKLVVDCYDVTPESPAIAVDGGTPVMGYSDIYSLDGSSWTSISESAIYANWMLGLNLESPETLDTPVAGYDVAIDGEKKNGTMLTSPAFDYDFGTDDGKQHSIRIDTYYTVAAAAVEGGVTRFTLGDVAGIGQNTIGRIELRRGDNELTVNGEGVESVEIMAADGTSAARADGNTVSLGGIPAGTYIVKVVAGGKPTTRKIVIAK